jgi:hypothetical protein
MPYAIVERRGLLWEALALRKSLRFPDSAAIL